MQFSDMLIGIQFTCPRSCRRPTVAVILRDSRKKKASMAVSTARSVWRGAVGARRMRVEAAEYAGLACTCGLLCNTYIPTS